jgi:hypothetical protein
LPERVLKKFGASAGQSAVKTLFYGSKPSIQ